MVRKGTQESKICFDYSGDGQGNWVWRSAEVVRFITLPLARRSILAGVVLASARAMGEFGVTLMIAGNIPGRTQTLPLAIYDAVQTRQFNEANIMVFVLSALALLYIWGLVQLGNPIRLIRQKREV